MTFTGSATTGRKLKTHPAIVGNLGALSPLEGRIASMRLSSGSMRAR